MHGEGLKILNGEKQKSLMQQISESAGNIAALDLEIEQIKQKVNLSIYYIIICISCWKNKDFFHPQVQCRDELAQKSKKEAEVTKVSALSHQNLPHWFPNT